jgi:hypothetical protein
MAWIIVLLLLIMGQPLLAFFLAFIILIVS